MAPSGPCFIYNDVVIITPTITGASGASVTNVPVPATPDLNGLSTYEQLWALDPRANPLGIVTSNGVNHNFLAPYARVPVTRNYLLGSLGSSGTVASFSGMPTMCD